MINKLIYHTNYFFFLSSKMDRFDQFWYFFNSSYKIKN